MMTERTFQVLTYNMHKGFGPGQVRFQLHKMRTAIASINADLVLLQEVQGEHKRKEKRHEDWPSAAQFEFLADTLWPHFAYGKNAIYQAGHHGNAILSKYPFLQWDNIDVSIMKRASRSVLHGVLIFPDTEIRVHVLCIHFGLLKAERQEQCRILLERIHQVVGATEPLIIAGDFNDWRNTEMDALEQVLGLKEVFKELQGSFAKTFPALAPTLQIDRIYFRGLTLLTGERLQGKTWRLLSDHLPLYAKFSLTL